MPRAPTDSSSVRFVGRLDDVIGHSSYPETQDRHNTEVTKLWDQITQAKEDLAAEETKMAEERDASDAQAQTIQAENYQLLLDQNASNEVLRRRHHSLTGGLQCDESLQYAKGRNQQPGSRKPDYRAKDWSARSTSGDGSTPTNRQPAAVHNTPAGSLLYPFGQYDSSSILSGSYSDRR